LPGPVVINARAAMRKEISGVERWATEMVARLPLLRPGAYAIAAPRERFAYGLGHLWEQSVLPLRARRMRASAIFSPANVAPVTGPPGVVVLHDAVMLSHPEWYSRPYRLAHAPLLRTLARTAHRVIVPPAFSAGELSDLAGVPRDRIDIVPGGVDERFRPDADPEPARRALGLERPYVLTVGGTGLRKNLKALAPLAPELDARGLDLVAAGFVRAHLTDSPEIEGIRALGYVPEHLLPGLYAGATAFVLPSLHEGFGLPCIEAMRAGVAVAASDRGAVPEACGGAALLFDPDDPDATLQAVLRTVDDAAERERLRAAGLAHAATLTWGRAARAVDQILAARFSL
jgi:glycosyltransferase involved in cell wall biosynthesis